MSTLNTLVRTVLRLIYRPSLMKMAYELTDFYTKMLDHVADLEIKPEVVKKALKIQASAVNEATHQAIVNEIMDSISTKYTEQMQVQMLPLKASLLSTNDLHIYYEMVAEIRKDLFPKVSAMIMLKLVNAMAELDFKKVFGCTREEWNKQKRPKDVLDPIINAVKEKQPLPDEIRQVLEELNGIVPFNFDYESIN